jgi:hypothetical protein
MLWVLPTIGVTLGTPSNYDYVYSNYVMVRPEINTQAY